MSDSKLDKEEIKIPDEADKFIQEQLHNPHQKEKEQKNLDLLQIRNDDYRWKVDNRGVYGNRIFNILRVQNGFVLGLIILAYLQGCLSDIEWLIGAIFTGLMAQTYFTANHLIRWLFTDIDYKSHR